MKINQLLSLNEAGPRTAAQQASMQAAASGTSQPNLQVVPGGRSNAGTAAPSTAPATTPPATTAPAAAPSAQPGKFGQIAKAVGKAGLSGLKAVGRAAPGVIGAVGNIGSSAVQAAGNIAAQGAGGITQTLGAAGGGLMHGYKTARGGQRFSSPTTTSVASAPAASQAGQQELDQLKARLDRIEQLLSNRP